MTNRYSKIAIIALSTLMLALAGCKKDDKTAPVFSLETSSLDFEWGQTKEISYTTHRIAKVNSPVEVPEGWTCVLRGSRFVITAPGQGAANESGTIKLSAKSTTDATLSRDLEVAVRIAEELPAHANSIIVSEPGKRYKFDATRRGNETSPTITGAVKGLRLWSTSKTAIVNVSLEGDYLYFATGEGEDKGFVEGNALLAVVNKNDEVLWSWHIWATDFDPAAEPHTVGEYLMMNRNLGAFANSNATPEDVVRSYGLYYQWGRKDPFVGPVAWNSTATAPMYDSSDYFMTHEFEPSTEDIGTIEWAVAHPSTFIAGAEGSNYHWIFDHSFAIGKDGGEGLWDGSSSSFTSGPKTIYDPCPYGWRVPARDPFASLPTPPDQLTHDPEDFNVTGDYSYGWTFDIDGQEIYFPAAGRRSFSPTLAKPEDNFTNVVNDGEGVGYPVGFYWYSDTTNSFYFRRDYISWTLGTGTPLEPIARAGGFTIRCVAE
jgi:hypothetical protein